MSAITKLNGPASLTPGSFDDAKSFASALARAEGFVPRAYIGNPSAILAAIVMGSEIGIGPMQSLRAIHVIDGKPQLSADLMLALAIRAGVRVQWLRSDAEEARCKLTREGFPDHEHAFTIAEAKAAGLAGRGNWSKYTASMLRARCISHALRAWAPDVLGAGVYVEGEIEEARAVEAAPAAVVELEQPTGEQAPAEDIVEAEQACAEPDAPASVEAPARLDQCKTAEELRAWLGQWGARVVESGRLGHVEGYADKIGVSRDDVRQWAGVDEGSEA
jgi:hypothetical protein